MIERDVLGPFDQAPNLKLEVLFVYRRRRVVPHDPEAVTVRIVGWQQDLFIRLRASGAGRCSCRKKLTSIHGSVSFRRVYVLLFYQMTGWRIGEARAHRLALGFGQLLMLLACGSG